MPKVGTVRDEFWPAPHAQGLKSPTPDPPIPRQPIFDFGHAYDPGRMKRPAKAVLHHHQKAPVRSLLGWAFVVGSAALAYAAHRTDVVDHDQIACLLGFGIEQVSLTGHRFTTDADLFDALDLGRARSLASFDPQGVRKRFERLPWVQSAEITRIWPDQLAIRVTERKPFAIWERGDTAELVDVTGRQLGPVKSDAALDLPRIAGDGANETAAQLLTALARYPAIKSKVVRARRLGDRRWTLDLARGGQLHLPSDGEVSALARLAAEPRLAALVDEPGQIVDLRSQSKIAVRAPATPPGGER